jgi:peptidoglycan biosynthesis/recognition FemAB-like protein
MTFSVAFVESARAIDAALWDACFAPPLEGRWWYETLEDSGLEDQFRFLYAVIRQDEKPVGIAPAFVMNFPVALVAPDALQPLVRLLGRIAPSLALPRTLFVGSPCADEGTVGLLTGIDHRAALIALQRALGDQTRALDAPLLVWKDVPPAADADMAWLAERDRLFRVVSFPGTLVELGASKEEYFGRLKGSRRHNVRKKIRRSAGQVAIAIEVVHSPPAAVLAEVFALFTQTYERATTRFERLGPAFFARVAREPVAHFILLREARSRELVAFMLCFDLGARLVNKFVGLDYARPKEWLLHFRLWDAALDWALARGAREIQSGQTGYAPKIETGHRLVPLANYCMHRNAIVHRLAALAARGIDWASLDDDLARYVRAHPEELVSLRR